MPGTIERMLRRPLLYSQMPGGRDRMGAGSVHRERHGQVLLHDDRRVPGRLLHQLHSGREEVPG